MTLLFKQRLLLFEQHLNIAQTILHVSILNLYFLLGKSGRKKRETFIATP